MGWYDAIKDALVVADQLKDAELMQKLVVVQLVSANLSEENVRPRQEILRDAAANAFFRSGPSGTKEGPFCPECHGEHDKVIRMTREHQEFRCPACRYLVGPPGTDSGAVLGFAPGNRVMDEMY